MADSALRDARLKMSIWESLGVTFGLTEQGELDIAFHPPMVFDNSARKTCLDFVLEAQRELHALVLCGDDPQALARFESVLYDRATGRRYRDGHEPEAAL